MKDILAPLEAAGSNGVVLTSGDGQRRRCHPIFATFVGDYPEQVLVVGAKSGDCPKGVLASELRGSAVDCTPRSHAKAADALRTRVLKPDDPAAFVAACKAADIKPIDAFWTDLPYTDVYQSITPDILHQLYQGIVKHLISWLKTTYGADAIDARVQRLPPNHQLRHFTKGITHLSHVSGTEHQDICRILLGVIVDLPAPGGHSSPRIQRAVRALLDYVYLAQYTEHSEESIRELELALAEFHANKQVFIDLGIREHFNFPKLHALRHYAPSVKIFGTADNFNTSYSERLHIDFAKSAWHSTNRKDEYPQMTLWLLRREKMHMHRRYVEWRLRGRPPVEDMPRLLGPREAKLKRNIARFPNVKSVSFQKAEQTYHAEDFEKVLRDFIAERNHPDLPPNQVENIARNMPLPFRTVAVYHRLKFWHPDALERDSDLAQDLSDCIHARPSYRDTQKRVVSGRFDIALVNENGDGEHVGIDGYRVAQVRMIFSLSEKAKSEAFFGDKPAPSHLAYVEWFKFTPSDADENHKMYRVKRWTVDGERVASVIPIEDIHRSVHLVPKFGQNLNRAWTSTNVLEECLEFYVNSFSDKHAYVTIR